MKTLPTNKEFTLTDYQRGVIATLNDVSNYMDQTFTQPIRKSISVTLTAYAQEHFKYPEGTELQFDIDPTDDKGIVKVTEVPNENNKEN